jgi:hypothetical protein
MPNPSSRETEIPTIPLAPQPKAEIPIIPLSTEGNMRREDNAAKKLLSGVTLMVIGSSLAGAGIAKIDSNLGTVVAFGGYGLSSGIGLFGFGLWLAKDNGDLDFSEKPYFPTQEEIWSAENQKRAAELGENVISGTITSIARAIRTK